MYKMKYIFYSVMDKKNRKKTKNIDNCKKKK